MTKNCPECEVSNIDSANYCHSCGHKFIDVFTADTRIVEYHAMVDADDQELKDELKIKMSDFFMGYFESTYMRHDTDNLADIYGTIAIAGKVKTTLDNEDLISDFQKVYGAGMLDYDADVKNQTIYYMLSDPMKKMLMLFKNDISLDSNEGIDVQRELRLLSKQNSNI
jgi:hypothetical protein